MNRADRRRLQRTARKAFKGKTGQLTHPVPDSVSLAGGPMDGQVVKPDAPALRPDWYLGLVEAKAAGLYNASLSPTGETFAPPKGATPWAKLSADAQAPFREQALAVMPVGRYVLDGSRARWAELN